MTNQVVKQALWEGGPNVAHRYAQRGGFPNAHALGEVLRIASKLTAGEYISGSDIAAVGKVYPSVPIDAIRERATAINNLSDARTRSDALIHAIVGPRADMGIFRPLVESYQTQEMASAINDKREERRRENDPTAAQLKREAAHPVRQLTDDAAERRAQIEALMAETKPAHYGARREAVAKKLESVADRMELSELRHATGKSVARTDDIAAAFDFHEASAEATELLDAEEMVTAGNEALEMTHTAARPGFERSGE